jgi:hypothetical protein
MATQQHRFTLTLLLIFVLCVNLFNVSSVYADGETPTEPPVATQVETETAATEVATEIPTEPPVEETPVPSEATPLPEETTATPVPSETTPLPEELTPTPVAELLTQVPESTEVIVLDENGETLPLASEEASEIVEVVDPMWCPEGVLPGGPGCTTNFASIFALINNMEAVSGNYAQNGVIYFTSNPGSGNFQLNPTTLSGGAFETLNDFNLTLQGGWNGDSIAPSFSGQTDFGTHPIVIGTSVNPWVGNLTLNDITFSNATQTSLTIYTDSGDITLNNVDVNNQRNGNNTAVLSSSSGDITVTDGTFDGNGTNSSGFSATTATGSITINDSSFTDSRVGTGTRDGATLSATTVTLTNVIATNNDGDGITINNASVVTLNNVVATNNGTNPPGPVPNDGSGVVVNGPAGTNVFVNGGNFSSNLEYGIEVGDPATTTIYVGTDPACTGNVYGCSNDTFILDGTGPVITPNINGTLGSGGWYRSNVTVSWSVNDPESGISLSAGCTDSNLTADTAGTTLTCSAANNVGLANSVSVTVMIDQTAPVLSIPSDITTTATDPSGAVVNYSASATDNVDPAVSPICAPASGSTFGPGTTTVSCSATDEAGNTGLGGFLVTVTSAAATATNTPTSTETATPTPPTATQAPSDTTGSSSSGSNSSTSLMPVTGGLINLECDSVFSAFGVKLSFVNLCDQQASLKDITTNNLPGKLPNGLALVVGIDVQILSDGQVLETLPDGSGIQLDFLTGGDVEDEFAVLYWDGSNWMEITQRASDDKVAGLVNFDAANELYQIGSSSEGSYTVLTTEQTGIFVLVEK